jgi:hypothetical protein
MGSITDREPQAHGTIRFRLARAVWVATTRGKSGELLTAQGETLESVRLAIQRLLEPDPPPT